jgi:hypothetical protein
MLQIQYNEDIIHLQLKFSLLALQIIMLARPKTCHAGSFLPVFTSFSTVLAKKFCHGKKPTLHGGEQKLLCKLQRMTEIASSKLMKMN